MIIPMTTNLQRLLIPAAVATPFGIALALLWSPSLGGALMLAGLGLGLLGLHRLGREGPT